MPTNAFIGRLSTPSEDELRQALGVAHALWGELVTRAVDELGLDEREWNSYSAKAGWALRLKRKGRNIVYLSPCAECFLASFALGEKAVNAARHAGLPPEIVTNISGSRRYAEGTAVRVEVHTAGDVASVLRLAAIKLAN